MTIQPFEVGKVTKELVQICFHREVLKWKWEVEGDTYKLSFQLEPEGKESKGIIP